MSSSSFVHLEYSTSHPGVERFERVVNAAEGLRKGWTATRGLAGLLLAAMVATLVVVADQLMDTWADGHLMAAWVLMWVIGFSALALLAPTARSLAARTMGSLDGWSQNVARRRADERLWDLARKDSRVMADIQAAASRDEEQVSDVAAETETVEQGARGVLPETAARLKRLSRRIWNE